MLQDLLEGAGRSIVFGAVGIGLMALGYVLIDLLTPGKLRDLIWVDRNPNASLLLAANQLGISLIVFTAIFTCYDSFGQGLASTVIFGLVGIAVMGLAFLVLAIPRLLAHQHQWRLGLPMAEHGLGGVLVQRATPAAAGRLLQRAQSAIFREIVLRTRNFLALNVFGHGDCTS